MKLHPQNYAFLTLSPLNINILDYYAECHRLDNQPYIKENTFVRRVDDAELRKKGYYELSESQFQELVSFFRKELGQDRAFRKTLEFALNQLAINTEKGLYVLAYRRLFLDIKNKRLVPAKEITLNWEFKIEGGLYRVSQFLAEDDQHLLDDFEKNQKTITDKIHEYTEGRARVDDFPHVFSLERDYNLDLNSEYQGIVRMFSEERAHEPLRAFFGKLKTPSNRRKNWPLILMDRKVDIDQLLAIHKGLKHPLTYIQGPGHRQDENNREHAPFSIFSAEKRFCRLGEQPSAPTGFTNSCAPLSTGTGRFSSRDPSGNRDVVFQSLKRNPGDA